MSLHQLAQHVQKAGRGEDTVLIHMTPKEVNGLQALAMKHGGSLTINPETGLPEAGFLKNILPMIAGFALAPLTAGTSLAFLGATPLASALTVGAATGLATGNLQKGLMAGLGAYGGASLGAGLSSAGADVAASKIAAPALTGNTVTNASLLNPYVASVQAAKDAALTQTPFATMGQGLQAAVNNPSAFMNNMGGVSGLAKTGVMATLPSLMQQPNIKEQKSNALIRPYEFTRTQNPQAYDQGNPIYAENPGSSRERNYFTDQYTALTPYKAPGPEYEKAAGGGLMGLNAFAVGGPVEQMSAQNAVAANHTYPQSQIETSMYTNPMVQRPVSNNVITNGIDAPVDPYTGEARFAKGGKTTGEYKYDYNPQTQQFTQTAAPKPVSTGLFSPLLAEISARTNVYGGGGGGLGGMYLSQPRQNATPAPTTPVAPAGIAPQTQQQPMYQPQQAAPMPAYQSPEQQLGLDGFYNYMNQQLGQGYAGGGNVGGEYNLGGYSDGGRLLKGPGDGVSDSIPAVIGNRQPARLADGEFVVPARIVSELGNGSTEAGARKLYAMMDRVQKTRKKSIGKGKVAVNSRAEKLLPA